MNQAQQLHGRTCCFQIHWPASRTRGPTVQPPLRETWAAMEALVEEGLVRSIGVSNFSAAKLTALLAHARIRPGRLSGEKCLLTRRICLVYVLNGCNLFLDVQRARHANCLRAWPSFEALAWELVSATRSTHKLMPCHSP